MQARTLFLAMEKFDSKTKSFTFYIRHADSDKVSSYSPSELMAEEKIKAHLNTEELERVAYVAGMQAVQNLTNIINRLKAVSKPAVVVKAKPKATRKRATKNS
jgi:hypothetical protein